MLKFGLAPEHTVPPWMWTGHRWVAGGSWIEPFVNPALENFCLTDGHSTLFVVRERRSSATTEYPRRAEPAHVRPSVYSVARRDVYNWPLEFFLIEAENQSAFRFTAGMWGIAPISVIERGGTLYGSWSWADLRPHLSAESLCEPAVARYLARRSFYSRHTIFRSLFQVTERASGSYSPAGLRLCYPKDALHAQPRVLRENADVVSAFERLLAGALGRYDLLRDNVGVELSGGCDSANTALSVADLLGDRVPSYGLLVGGHAGRQQQRRRAELAAHGNFADHTVDATDYAPFDPSGARARGAFLAPHEEPYVEALGTAVAAAAVSGVRVVVTGVGGDELMSLRAWERRVQPAVDEDRAPFFLTNRLRDVLREPAKQPPAPGSVVSEPSLCAVACRSPTFLRTGCWPISPLCTHELIRFCEWLPTDWRRDKRLLRTTLEGRGLPFDVVYPQHRENFVHVMDFGLRTHTRRFLDDLTSASVLVDRGFVDGAHLIRWRKALDDPGSALDGLYEVLNLETSLRALS